MTSSILKLTADCGGKDARGAFSNVLTRARNLTLCDHSGCRGGRYASLPLLAPGLRGESKPPGDGVPGAGRSGPWFMMQELLTGRIRLL